MVIEFTGQWSSAGSKKGGVRYTALTPNRFKNFWKD
jgi:hypothetical protein